MRKEIKNKDLLWIDIINPDKNDVKFLKSEYNISHLVLDEYIPSIKRPRVEEYENYLFVVVHFPVFIREKRKTKSRELDIILFKNVLITSHNDSFFELSNIFKECLSSKSKMDYYIKNNAAHLAYLIIDRLINLRMPMLDHIDDHISRTEKEIFEGNEKKMVKEIAIIKHDLIDFRKIIKPQRAVLESLARAVPRITGDNMTMLSSEIIGSNIKIWNTLENHKEMIEALEHTNESLLSYKMNNTVKILTAFSVIMLPLSLIANIFGMNVTNGMPFMSSSIGFWIIFIIMILITLISFLFFRFMKWI